ncbi:gamma-glutamyltranspeptidase/glutathione hydrolase [Roseibium hamelinense]|uniref:Gamma-glutamyltranspeptidase/glutathione hydrolase n=1 Tax=Roseibium hamelinense TaxID=150831 RepID=A0A562SM38_9HYPH|nr:gamma-glutamyltransferase family protein [Roseibium hamelinense]MTI45068.1 gamma-glutamyltransferase family protein [Roseibium hamelinense]TWI82332.1 gamma-glutamyltranspeptidase/glutathione hydrolase [Roseibium hamelinense]
MDTVTSSGGMVVAPHKAAADAGAEILRDGGSAIEAMIAAASTIAVVYPHMNAIGGDGFWLIAEHGKDPKALMACGGAGSGASIKAYNDAGYEYVPTRGPLAALTVAGTVAGWDLALEAAKRLGKGKTPRRDLLAAAVRYAKEGIVVSKSQAELTTQKLPELAPQPGFANVFLLDGKPPQEGDLLKQERLADTLEHLGLEGFVEFYKGDVGASIAADLEQIGSPVTRADLGRFEARFKEALKVQLKMGTIFNAPLPTQGLASLIILALFDRLSIRDASCPEYVHALVEATKRAFLVRDRLVTDPAYAPESPRHYLKEKWLDSEAAKISLHRALEWPTAPSAGDTIWMGAVDKSGLSVSFIQSIYWEFGSGCVLPQTGITWQNRGSSFSLRPDALNALAPGRLPFHTLNPAMARMVDGRTVTYGTMGGEGQPQTQAAIYSRHIMFSQSVGAAIDAPRWLLGRTWGDETAALRLENRFDPDTLRYLEKAGHNVVVLDEDYSDTMGHAGMIVRNSRGGLEGAHDPRADGGAAIA